jgi:hypothetical protein
MSQRSPQIFGINNPLMPKTDTEETENLDKAISLDQEGVLTPAKQIRKDRMADSGSSLHP